MKKVLVFNNPKQNQMQIMQAVKGFGGIYIWTNLQNWRKYLEKHEERFFIYFQQSRISWQLQSLF
jgi:hypothetical protein